MVKLGKNDGVFSLQMTLELIIKRRQFYLAVVELLLIVYLAKSLAVPRKPVDIPFNELIQLMNNHQNPKGKIIPDLSLIRKPDNQMKLKPILYPNYDDYLSTVIMERIVARRCSARKGVLRNFAEFTGKHLCQSLS